MTQTQPGLTECNIIIHSMLDYYDYDYDYDSDYDYYVTQYILYNITETIQHNLISNYEHMFSEF